VSEHAMMRPHLFTASCKIRVIIFFQINLLSLRNVVFNIILRSKNSLREFDRHNEGQFFSTASENFGNERDPKKRFDKEKTQRERGRRRLITPHVESYRSNCGNRA